MSALTVPTIRHTSALCNGYSRGYFCTRPLDHEARHAATYPSAILGRSVVVEVWGTDVHQAARERGQAAITLRANERLLQVVDLIDAGVDPDAAWSSVEAEAAAS
jgi:hypothetical protein